MEASFCAIPRQRCNGILPHRDEKSLRLLSDCLVRTTLLHWREEASSELRESLSDQPIDQPRRAIQQEGQCIVRMVECVQTLYSDFWFDRFLRPWRTPRGRESVGKQVQTFGDFGWSGCLKDAFKQITLVYIVGFRCKRRESKSAVRHPKVGRSPRMQCAQSLQSHILI